MNCEEVASSNQLFVLIYYHKMTQEYLAEKNGVSRQAVSKWENGVSEPSTSNLMAIAKLYQLYFEKLLKDVHID